ncbi:MAG: hypothetical protein RSD26_03430 [Cellulosilyticaceae bacterium]
MTNRQVLEIRMNQLELLLIACKEHPEYMYTHISNTLQHMKEQAEKNEIFLHDECQLTY